MEEFVKRMLEERKEIMSFGAKLIDRSEKLKRFAKRNMDKLSATENTLMFLQGAEMDEIIDRIDNYIRLLCGRIDLYESFNKKIEDK